MYLCTDLFGLICSRCASGHSDLPSRLEVIFVLRALARRDLAYLARLRDSEGKVGTRTLRLGTSKPCLGKPTLPLQY